MADREIAERLAIVRSHNLAAPEVRYMLAGYLSVELREVHGVQIARADLGRAFAAYIAAAEAMFDNPGRLAEAIAVAKSRMED
jgi:hypothetical protein